MSPAPAQATWTKPGPGTWELDRSHCSAAPGPIQRDLYEHALATGMKEGLDRFGSPLSHMEMRWVHGKFYRRLVPAVGGNADLPDPPRAVMWLATRLHPELRRRERLAGETLRTKRWMEEIERWEREWKPQLLETNRAFAAVDVAAIDDAALAEHVEALAGHLLESTTLHFRLHVSDMGPLGMLMVRLEDWGLHRDDTFRALVAASPATRGPAEQLAAIADAVAAAGVDLDALHDLDAVRQTSPDAAHRLDAFLADHGWRLTTGYDIEDRCLIELPDVVLTAIRAARASRRVDDDHHQHVLDGLRAEIPDEHLTAFDEAVADARASYGLRDENGPLTYEWPAGLLRRALLEAGNRLAGVGALAEAADVFELRAHEVAALLVGSPGPSLEEVAERAATRRWEAALDPPARLGREATPPPIGALTPNLAYMTRVILTVVGSLETDPHGAALRGTGVGSEPYSGTARVVHDAAEALAQVEPGDIIVAPYTAPTYNAVLGMAGAIVTEEGGLLCHAAVIARELGLPAVIGARGAMSEIRDGSRVEVDPVAGVVRLL